MNAEQRGTLCVGLWRAHYLGAFIALRIQNTLMCNEFADLTRSDEEVVEVIRILSRSKEGDRVYPALEWLRAQRTSGANRMYRTITQDDVGLGLFEAFGRKWSTHGFIGRITSNDVGKRVYLVGDILQVENNEQRDKRVGGRTSTGVRR